MNNAVTKEGASLVEVYRANNTYMNVSAEIEEMQSALTTDLETHIWNVNGTIKKALKDASGSSNTPASRVFFSDSEGAASSDSVLIYDSINKKLGIGVSPAIGAKLHLHQASTANTLMKLSNASTGSGEHNGLNIGVVGDSYVVRTQYARPIVIETENPSEQGQYLEIAKFQKTGSVSNTILNSDLKVNTIVAKSTAATVFLTHENNTIKTRTAAQVLDDIGAQPSNSNLTAIAGLTPTDGNFIVGNGSTFVGRKLQNSDLPAIAITDTFIVSSQAAMLALVCERGDVAVRSDLNKSFILKGNNPALLSDWQELLTPTDNVLSVDGRTGVIDLSDKYQPLDSDLTTIAGLTHTNRHVMISNGTTWTRRALVEDDLPSLSAAKITSGTLDNARLSFDPSSFAKLSLGTVRAAGGFATSLETGRDVFASGLYTYRFMGDALNKPAGISLGSVLTWGHGVAGAGQLAVGWATGDHNKLVFRSLRDIQNDWWDWKEIYHTGYKPTPDDIGAATASHTHSAIDLPANVVYTDNAQTISGVKTFNANTNFGNTVTLAGTNKWIISNTATTDKNSVIVLGYPNTANSGYVGVHEINHATKPGDVVLQAGGSNGAIYMSPRAYFGSRPANDHRWTLALDQYNTLYGAGSGTNIMHNLYYDGYWRYRYGSGSNSGGVITRLTYNQFSVQVADNGIADQIATLKYAIHTNLSGNTAFGKSTFVSSDNRVEVEGNALINGNARIEGSLAMEATAPFLTITPYTNGGIIFNTPSGPDGQHAHWITRSANDGVLSISREFNGESSLMMAFAPNVNDILFNSDIYFSRKNLFDVCLSGEVSYNDVKGVSYFVGQPINTDDCPGIDLNTPASNDFTLTGGIINQRIFVRNGTAQVQYVDGCRIEPGQFRDFLKTGTGWTASGASISGKTINVSSGTGNISVSNVSTVRINFSPTSTYTLTDGYVGQRVTVVVLGSAQHWIQGAAKAHKVVAGEFRDFIYTTDGWAASAADY